MPIDMRQWVQEQNQINAERGGQGGSVAGGGGNQVRVDQAREVGRATAPASAQAGTQQVQQAQSGGTPRFGDTNAMVDYILEQARAAAEKKAEEDRRKREEDRRRKAAEANYRKARKGEAGYRAQDAATIAMEERDALDAARNEEAAERAAQRGALNAQLISEGNDRQDARDAARNEDLAERQARGRSLDPIDMMVNEELDAFNAERRRTADERAARQRERDARDSRIEEDVMDSVYRDNGGYDDRTLYDRIREKAEEWARQGNRGRVQAFLRTLTQDELALLQRFGVDAEQVYDMDADELVRLLRDLKRLMVDEVVPEVPSRGELIASRVPMPRMSTSEFADRWADSTQELTEEMARQRGERTALREYDPENIPFRDDVDSPYVDWTDVTDIRGGEDRIFDFLMGRAGRVNEGAYEAMREHDGGVGPTDAEEQAKGLGGVEFDPLKSESSLRRMLMDVRNAMLNRFLNPSLMRIEGQKVTVKEVTDASGKTHKLARIEYGERTMQAIGLVRQVYDCSMHNVLQLVQLRASLGIDSKGHIGKVDPDKFKLSEDQFVELCMDIKGSQERNGHPLGPVEPRMGSWVRDDSGKYVVVAGTRCFPLGYMPRQLVADLSRNHTSPLHGKSERQIETMIGETWLNSTYPDLLANTTGALMWQARAIENMMRGLMTVDGVDPSGLGIPEVVERETLMMLEAEAQSIGDSQVRGPAEMRMEQYDAARQRMLNRYTRNRRTRSESGGMQSAATWRKRNEMGDLLGWVTSCQRKAQSMRIPIMLSSPLEELLGMAGQDVAMWCTDFYIRNSDRRDADGQLIPVGDYEYTAQLDDIARRPETSESLRVANSLYRIGGWDLIDVYLNEKNPGSNRGDRWALNERSFNEFLAEYGISGTGSPLPNVVPDRLRELLHIDPRDDAAFMSNTQNVIDSSESVLLSNGIFDGEKARTFTRIAMMEMAQARIYGGRESYTSDQVAAWAMGETGGEEMVRSLLKLDAGREAFMTEGATGLGRKSLIEHMVRRALGQNRVTEFVVRTFFDRFPEYGIQKVLNQMPMSNTLGYITSLGIRKVGDIASGAGQEAGSVTLTNIGNAMRRAGRYQMGMRMTFKEGLRKNLLYDMVMAGGRIAQAGVYFQLIMAFGGVMPPDDEAQDRYTWSEWSIGTEQDSIKLKYAWWMDDLSGVGLPLGMALAICEQGGWSYEAKSTAANVFINAIANLDSGTAVFDAIDMINNPQREFDTLLGLNLDLEGSDAPSTIDKAGMAVTLSAWNLIGSMTPQIVNELCPWSKDYLFLSGEDDAHTPYKMWDRGKESRYDTEQAYDEYRTRDATWREALLHRASQSNIIMAVAMNLGNLMRGDEDATGYFYSQMPLDTIPETYMANSYYDKYYLDLDPTNADPNKGGGIPIDDAEKRKEVLYARADEICQHVSDHYHSAEEAYADGFILNFDARINCINYCYAMIDEAYAQFKRSVKDARAASVNNWVEDDLYSQFEETRDSTIDHYKYLLNTYFNYGNVIPWRVPRYVRQESDNETRYVDGQGQAGTYLGTIGALRNNDWLKGTLRGLGDAGNIVADAIGDEPMSREQYAYGNKGDLLPATTPITEGKGYNFETIPPFAYVDEDGNLLNEASIEAVFEHAGELPAVPMGRFAGNDLQEQYFGGQGSNRKDDVTEEMNIAPNETPTMGRRNYRIMDEILPEELQELLKDPEGVSKLLGIESSIPDKDKSGTSGKSSSDDEEEEESSTPTTTSTGRSYGGGGGGYSGGRRYYSYSSGGGSNSQYNPKIYSSPRQVYSQRASGMSTRQPYKATTTYLRPSFYTKGSRQAYRRQD